MFVFYFFLRKVFGVTLDWILALGWYIFCPVVRDFKESGTMRKNFNENGKCTLIGKWCSGSNVDGIKFIKVGLY